MITRKKALLLLICMALLLSISGCKSTNNDTQSSIKKDRSHKQDDLKEARSTLIKFFMLLNEKEYSEATKYYGGSYSELRYWNPSVDKNDYAALLKAGCKMQLMCLPIRRIVKEQQLSVSSFKFTVEFTKTDGKLFVIGPFPDQTPKDAVSRFDYIVKKKGGNFLVQGLPPYVP